MTLKPSPERSERYPKGLLLVLMLITWLDCRSVPVGSGFSAGKFSDLMLYHRSSRPRRVAVFISGDGGWHADLEGVAEGLAEQGYLIIGVDISTYLDAVKKEPVSCVDLASDFHEMVRSVEAKMGYEQPVAAVIIGHSAGASMVYGILKQSSPGSVLGGISLGFSPGYDSPKPFCDHSGLTSNWNKTTGEFDLQSGGSIGFPWTAIHGTADGVCPFRDAVTFVQSVHGARFVPLIGADHDITAPKMVSALKKALSEMTR